ncbi:MAG: metal-dependent hydrolase [Candidatus Kerfeldbacteria bacterium]|nr:metal-dependent hydrolase [Candidatus Kerfeldbacteria bacterium]
MSVKVTFLGHAAVLLQGSKSVIIDPFFTNNPQTTYPWQQAPQIDLVLVTHDHFDHVGQAVELAKRDGATLVAIHELATSPAVADQARVTAVGMNIGGTYRHQGVAISMTPAVHSASRGSPAGFVVELDGQRIYHAGDTAVFSDMALIPKLFGKLDVALLPIGGHYVMDAKQAALAAKLLKSKLTIPIHYNTWPVIAADPQEFVRLCRPQKAQILRPGESINLDSN